MQLNPSTVHVWSVNLNISSELETTFFSLLNPEERIRANRFRPPFHRKRFIAARGALRQLLGNYLDTPPELLEFGYNEHKKPYLLSTNIEISFNVSHSRDYALIAITMENRVGIDVEKVREKFNLAIAERYFSSAENTALQTLPSKERPLAFYRLWARKEAVVKAMGKGLTYPMSSFTVSLEPISEVIDILSENWYLAPLVVSTDYVAALATQMPIENIVYYSF